MLCLRSELKSVTILNIYVSQTCPCDLAALESLSQTYPFDVAALEYLSQTFVPARSIALSIAQSI
jgi:hypothetical protein